MKTYGDKREQILKALRQLASISDLIQSISGLAAMSTFRKGTNRGGDLEEQQGVGDDLEVLSVVDPAPDDGISFYEGGESLSGGDSDRYESGCDHSLGAYVETESLHEDLEGDGESVELQDSSGRGGPSGEDSDLQSEIQEDARGEYGALEAGEVDNPTGSGGVRDIAEGERDIGVTPASGELSSTQKRPASTTAQLGPQAKRQQKNQFAMTGTL